MAISTDKLAPRIIINEREILADKNDERIAPVTMIFGFSPIGKTCEMVVCNNITDILNEFGQPKTAAEKYFIDAGLRLVQQDATAIMTRLPYDNDQSHTVKYVDFKIESPIALKDIASGPLEIETRKIDDNGVTILKEMNYKDPLMSQFQRITQIKDSENLSIGKMTSDKLVELELDPLDNLPTNTFRIVDIRSDQYGTGLNNDVQYTGIFPVIVSAPMALYYQGKIENSNELDECFKLLDLSEGIEVYTSAFRAADPADDDFKLKQRQILSSITQDINFNTTSNKFHRKQSLQDACLKNFPLINFMEKDRFDKSHLKNIGLLVCQLYWDNDTQTSKIKILESYVGLLGKGRDAIDKKINNNSKYIRMYKNLSIDSQTDFFVVDGLKLTSLGMEASECAKNINYKTSILDPIQFMLEGDYSDIDSFQVDVILDAGLSSIAFAAYVEKDQNGDSFKTNPNVVSKINWTRNEYPIDETIEDYAFVWNQVTRLFGDFIKSMRGDCVYIADGPRILNLERNYPIRNYTDMDNIELFNKYLPLFNGYTNNYVARYFNWVYIEDLQYDGQGLWVPPSVVIGSQLAINDMSGQVWYAPAGQRRGLINGAFDVSVKTRQYTNENDILYSNNWNFFNIYQNDGVIIDGQKTLQVKKTSLDRLNVRRMVCYIKQQIRIISNRYKYEPHTASVRASYVQDLNEMLRLIHKTSGISDFMVVCDSSNNTTETIDRHELHCKVFIKPIKAIEYILIDLDVLNGKIGMDESVIVQD